MKQLNHFIKNKKKIKKKEQTNKKTGSSLTDFIFIKERRVFNESEKVKLIEIDNLPRQVSYCKF